MKYVKMETGNEKRKTDLIFATQILNIESKEYYSYCIVDFVFRSGSKVLH